MSNVTVNIKSLFENMHIHVGNNCDVPQIKQKIEQAILEVLAQSPVSEAPPLPETEQPTVNKSQQQP